MGAPRAAFLYSTADLPGEHRPGISVTEFEITPVRALNPIGAGDTCSSVLLYAMCAGYKVADAFAFALAAASGEDVAQSVLALVARLPLL